MSRTYPAIKGRIAIADDLPMRIAGEYPGDPLGVPAGSPPARRGVPSLRGDSRGLFMGGNERPPSPLGEGMGRSVGATIGA